MPEAMHQILVTDWVEYPRATISRNILGRVAGYGLLTATGNEHKYTRKAMNPAFSIPNLTSQFSTYFKPINDSKKNEEKESEKDKIIHVYDWISKVTLVIICKTAYGYKAESLQNPCKKLAEAYELLLNLQSLLIGRTILVTGVGKIPLLSATGKVVDAFLHSLVLVMKPQPATLWHLSKNTEGQARLRAELAQVFTDVAHADYRLLKEHQFLENIRVVNTWKEIWVEDAEDFKSERWLNLRKAYHPTFSMLSFITGPHACISKTMAIMEIKAVLACVFSPLGSFGRSGSPIVKIEFAPIAPDQVVHPSAAITTSTPASRSPPLSGFQRDASPRELDRANNVHLDARITSAALPVAVWLSQVRTQVQASRKPADRAVPPGPARARIARSAHARTYANIILRFRDAHNVAVMTRSFGCSGGDRAALVAFQDVK
ncbi:hypothetical protein HYPSUDRAFT_50603 [Hypholoma sublateritium FD-334 SS-4]|uniref:Cytochrome P450 n=1 Tax=Hypholoma sublateritium (strain FD-334 SS-4) TaxID=945553 RepID=A0A0D2PQ57_HYPSF|nr:hypothetical protein HYPSUDRAFT_50603 [Hypholoma sublateritium FD-334 SS-4]